MSAQKKFAIPLLIVIGFASGCAQAWPTPRQPSLGMEASGEELWVRTQAHQATYATKEKVGEVVHKDSSGQNVGTSEVYENRMHTVHWTTWYPMQGDTQLDDEDFLRIVGNEQALDEHRAYRETGLAMNKWGKGMIVGGLVGFIASYFVPAENYTLRYGLSTGGLLVGSGGWYFARMGAARFEPEAHTVDPSRANYDMQRYNRSLAGGGEDKPQASLSIGKKF